MAPFRFEEQKNQSLRHKISDEIRRAIIQGKLKPGERLREMELSEQMGISRGTVREAMRMLEQEGILYSQPYKETTVAEIKGEEVLEVLIPIRLIIEQFAVRKGVPALVPEDIARLEEQVELMKKSVEQKDLGKIVEHDLKFHELLVSLSRMNNLMGIWSSIYNRIRLHFLLQGQSYEDFGELWKTHERLLESIRSRNIPSIEEELRRHIYDTNVPYLKELN